MLNASKAAAISSALSITAILALTPFAYPADSTSVSIGLSVEDRCSWENVDPDKAFNVEIVSGTGKVLSDERGANRFAMSDGDILTVSGIDRSDGVGVLVEPSGGFQFHYSVIPTQSAVYIYAQCVYTGEKPVVRMVRKNPRREAAELDGSITAGGGVSLDASDLGQDLPIFNGSKEYGEPEYIVEKPATAEQLPSIVSMGDRRTS